MKAVFYVGTRSAGNRSSRALASNYIKFWILSVYMDFIISQHIHIMEILLLVWLQACIELSKSCHGNSSQVQ